MRRRSALAAVLAVGLIAAVAVFAAPRAASDAKRPTRPAFVISGTVKGLYPGRRTRLTLTLRNTRPRAIVVRSVRVFVANAQRGCRASNVRVGRFTGWLRIRPHGRRAVRVPISLAAAAPDACRGATFRLRFRGRAVMGR